MMQEKLLRRALPELPPERLLVYETLPSTNALARELASAGAAHGTAVLADTQSAGRGRMGRTFVSPPDCGIYLSLILRPEAEASELLHLTAVLAVAACDAVEEVTGLRPGVKWINDLVLHGKKVGGILTELAFSGPKPDFAVAGIGLNCNTDSEAFPPELRQTAGSLAQAAGNPVDRTALAAALIRHWTQAAQTAVPERAEWMRRYRQDCVTVGQEVELLRGGAREQAFALGVEDDGALLVRLTDGTQKRVFCGEASVRGKNGYL